MKKRLAAFITTGVLTLGAFAGTVGAASATTARPDGEYCGSTCFYWQGAFTNSASCVDFVRAINELGVWDCEYYSKPYFSSYGPGWYATSRVII